MASETPSTYRGRLRTEGLTLAALGGVGSVALLVLADGATDGPASTIGQLVVVAVLLGIFGPRGVGSAITEAVAVDDLGAAGTGEPTPLWHLPLVVAVLAAPFLAAGLPDAALRVTGGCALVGLSQAVLLAGLVGRDEQATDRVYVRLPGSRILRGTRLGFVAPAP